MSYVVYKSNSCLNKYILHRYGNDKRKHAHHMNESESVTIEFLGSQETQALKNLTNKNKFGSDRSSGKKLETFQQFILSEQH